MSRCKLHETKDSSQKHVVESLTLVATEMHFEQDQPAGKIGRVSWNMED